jgi:hypothetical protein
MSRRKRRKWEKIRSELDQIQADYGYNFDSNQVSDEFLRQIQAINRGIEANSMN